MPNYKELKNLLKVKKNTYGLELKEDAKRYFGSLFSFYTPGEMLPNEDSYCEINPEKTDQWGIPVLNIRFKMGEQEHAQMKHKVEHIAEFLDTAGGHFLNGGNKNPELSPGGADRHEVGGARMSADPKNGVTNSWGQVWDCKNVSVADGAVFASSTYKNPTLTIMALALRVSEAVLKKI
jgi:choline dehydrogenase-like flavoprotein